MEGCRRQGGMDAPAPAPGKAVGILAPVGVGLLVTPPPGTARAWRAPPLTPVAILVLGIIIFFISFFGCCGAWKESYCMVTTVSTL
uniref:Uncharacterized protein n=1 Tax=Accipiter nisus TaxID=211598 RepID=A0A8B9NGW6_9AVES